MEKIYKDILFHIFIHTDVSPIIPQVCKHFNQVYNEEFLWKSFLKRDYDDQDADPKKKYIEYFLSKTSDEEFNKWLKLHAIDLSNVECMDMSSIGLTGLPIKIASLDQIKIIDLSNNSLDVLPDTFFLLKNIELLNLSYNNFSEIPKKISKLKNLKRFFMSANRLKSFPDEFFKLENIESFHVRRNMIEEIPDRICQMKKLKCLFIQGNPLKFIPEKLKKRNITEKNL